MKIKVITVPIAAKAFRVGENWIRFLCQQNRLTGAKEWHGRYIIEDDQKYKDLLALYKQKYKVKENNLEVHMK